MPLYHSDGFLPVIYSTVSIRFSLSSLSFSSSINTLSFSLCCLDFTLVNNAPIQFRCIFEQGNSTSTVITNPNSKLHAL